jgi:24-methylenesterol C-methyltransferase
MSCLVQSFHFSPKLPAKDWKQSEVAHESRIAAVLGLKPGMKCLDCGCGVGGPLRTIASVSGAHVTGITINEYQVSRARYHNEKVSLPDTAHSGWLLAHNVYTLCSHLSTGP